MLEYYRSLAAKYPALSHEEELNLYVKYLSYKDFDNKKAQAIKDKIILHNLSLTIKLALKYKNDNKLLDLIQEGNLFMIKGFDKFNMSKQIPLCLYLKKWARAGILKYLASSHRIVKLNSNGTITKLFWRYNKEKAKMEALGQEVSPELLAKKLNVPKEKILEFQLRNQNESNIDEIDISDTSKSIDDIDSERFVEKLYSYKETLSERDEKIYNYLYLSPKKYTFEEIGEMIGLTKQRVQQIDKRFKSKLKDFLGEEYSQL